MSLDPCHGIVTASSDDKQKLPSHSLLHRLPYLGCFDLDLHSVRRSLFEQKGEGWVYLLKKNELGLCFLDPSVSRPIFVSLETQKKRLKAGQGDLFKKALGRPAESLSLLDATAGLGQDMLFTFLLGFHVTACETSEILFPLLSHHQENLKDHHRLFCYPKDSLIFLSQTSNRFDLIYIDPMFPDTEEQTALPTKESQVLRKLASSDEARAKELVIAAKRSANKRVIVKRPLKSAPLSPLHPSDIQFKGKNTRFDVYLNL